MDEKPTPHSVSRREFLGVTGGLLTTLPALASDTPEASAGIHNPHSAAALAQAWGQSRPAWWRQEGVVMAGVDWESLLTRLRAGSYDFSQAFKIGRAHV